MKKKLLICALGALALFVFGAFQGWFHVEFSEAELIKIEDDWSQVEEWADPLTAVEGDETRLLGLCTEWQILSKQDEDVASQGTSAALEGFRQLLQEGSYRIPVTAGSTMELLQLGQAALPGASEEQLIDLLRFSRRLETAGGLAHFMAGVSIARGVLERKRTEDLALELPEDLPAPPADLLFAALCRDQVLLVNSAFSELDKDEWAESKGHKKVKALMKATIRRSLDDYYPLREEPHQFKEVKAPEPPSVLQRWRSRISSRPEDEIQLMRPLFGVNLPSLGTTWGEHLETWGELFGS